MSGGARDAYLKVGKSIGRTKPGVYFFRHVYDPLDKWVWRKTDGRRGLSPEQMPVLMLTTRGRRSGNEVTNPVLYLKDRERYVVVGSNYGRDRHPAWTYNLIANPQCRINIRGRERQAVARRAERHEVERLWPRLIEVWPGWTTYTEMTERDFRVFFLEPK